MKRLAPLLIALCCASTTFAAEEPVLNLYSSRHYNTDEALYANFEKRTGIKINRIEAQEDPLIERIKAEGDKSPADVLVTVDVGRIWRAEQLGFFQPVRSAVLDEKIPAELRHPDGLWYGFSVRARPIFYNKVAVDPAGLKNYEDLADPKYKGKVCARAGNHVYNLSLLSSIIAANGADKAEAWARGVVANFARAPKGGDTDQLMGVASGECGIAIGNTYYYVRLLKSAKPNDREAASKIGVIFPNQANRGAHVNVSGAGVLKNAPHKQNAIRFLEYLASAEAQEYFANGNNEYPVTGPVRGNSELASLGTFKRDAVNVSVLGRNQAQAAMIFDRAGWK